MLNHHDTLPRFTDPPSREGNDFGLPREKLDSTASGWETEESHLCLTTMTLSPASMDPLPYRALRLKGGYFLGIPLGDALTRKL